MAATAYGYHPEVKAYGTVAKDCYDGRSVFDYVDDDGLTSTLPFNRQEETTINLDIEDIVFEDAILNYTIAKGVEEKSTQITSTYDYLTVADKPYLYLKGVNSSAIVQDTAYYTFMTHEVKPNDIVTNDYNIFVTGKANLEGAGLDTGNSYGKVVLKFTDEGATTREIIIYFKPDAAEGVSITSGDSNILISVSGKSDYYTVQMKIQDLLDSQSKSWVFTKCTGISYYSRLWVSTVTPGDIYSSELWVRNAFLASSEVTLKDDTTDNVLLNCSSVSHVYDEGDTIDIVGKEVSIIKGLSVPFEAEDSSYDLEYVDGIEGFSYEHTLNLPTTTEAEADTLSYSSTNITLRSWFDGSFFTVFSSRGSDKLDDITNKDVTITSTTLMENRAWSYGVEDSLSVDTDYVVKMRVGNLPDDVIEALTEIPAASWNPASGSFWEYVTYKFWAAVSALTSFLGVGAIWAENKKRGSRRAVRIFDLMAPGLPGMMPMAQMPIMRTGKRRSNGGGNRISDLTQLVSIICFLASVGMFFYGYFYPSSMIGQMSQFTIALPGICGFLFMAYDSEY